MTLTFYGMLPECPKLQTLASTLRYLPTATLLFTISTYNSIILSTVDLKRKQREQEREGQRWSNFT